MSNITKFRTIESKRKEIESKPNEHLVEELEELLKQAKAGYIHTVVGCTISTDLKMRKILSGEYEFRCVNIIGMLSEISHDMLNIKNGK